VRVAIDLQLAVGTSTGIGEYARGLADALEQMDVEVVRLQNLRVDPWRFDRRVVWDQLLLPLAAARARANIVHCASGTMPLLRPFPVVVTVHDIAWLRVQTHARPYARTYFGAFSLRQYRAARRIVTDSTFSRSELLALGPFAPERVVAVWPGVSDDFARVVRRRGDEPTILAVGTVEPRKNLEVVIRAIATPPLARVRLLSTGPATPYLEHCRQLARSLGVWERVSFLGYVPRERLLELYATAAAGVAPSYYEGFGYAAAQALCAGLPLVAANASSLPEIVAGEAALVDPNDVAGWANALAGILGAPERSELVAAERRPAAIRRFAWPSSAARILDVYRAALDRSARGRSPQGQ